MSIHIKTVKLDYGQEIAISDEAFKQIEVIVKANMICKGCGKPYTSANPNVALNVCLPCFQKKHKNQGFTYIKAYTTNQSGNVTHWFVDPFHAVYFTTTNRDDPQKSEHDTLLYWRFPVPETWQDGAETKELSHFYWSIYGNPKTDEVLVIHNSLEYGSDRSVDFLTYRDGKTVQIDRRRGEGRRLFLKAKKRIEATKDSHGQYHIEDHTFYSMESYWLRYMVAKIANEEGQQQEGA